MSENKRLTMVTPEKHEVASLIQELSNAFQTNGYSDLRDGYGHFDMAMPDADPTIAPIEYSRMWVWSGIVKQFECERGLGDMPRITLEMTTHEDKAEEMLLIAARHLKSIVGAREAIISESSQDGRDYIDL